MAQQIINIGTEADDGTGDDLRTAFDKANDNFGEVYDAITGAVSGGPLAGTERFLGLDGPTNKTWLASQLATYIIALIVDGSPAALDTLNELAAALGDDPNFATTVTNALAARLTIANNLSDLANVSTARANLGLGGAAQLNVGTTAGTVAAGNDSRITGAGQLTGSGQIWTQRNTIAALTIASSSTTYNFGGISPVIQVHGGANSTTTIGAARWSADTSSGVLYLGKSRGAIGSYSAVQSGDFLGQVHAVGDDGTALQSSARIDAVATETFSGTARGSAWQFSVTTPGTVTKTIPLYVATSEVRPGTDNAVTLGTSSNRWSALYSVRNYYTATVFDAYGSGSPEGVVTAGIGSTYRRTDGGAGTSFYVKESGTGNTGWVAK